MHDPCHRNGTTRYQMRMDFTTDRPEQRARLADDPSPPATIPNRAIIFLVLRRAFEHQGHAGFAGAGRERLTHPTIGDRRQLAVHVNQRQA